MKNVLAATPSTNEDSSGSASADKASAVLSAACTFAYSKAGLKSWWIVLVMICTQTDMLPE